MTLFELILLFLVDVSVLFLSSLNVTHNLLGTKLVVKLLELVSLLLLHYHLLLALKLLRQLLFHVFALHVSVLVLFVEDHLPASLGSFILSLNICVTVEIWRHLCR